MRPQEYQDLVDKYKAKVRQEFGDKPPSEIKVTSREYTEFKQELYPASYSFYEQACNFAGNLLKLQVSKKNTEIIQKNLDICHLNVTPSGIFSLAILTGISISLLGSLFSIALPSFLGAKPLLILVYFFVIGGLITIPALQKVPQFMANTWRIKSSNQMVQSVFYMVTYMRHTSNLERAIGFAADHLTPPLSLDFRKILWDLESQRYSTIKESAESYLESWKEYNKEFVESFHLIESSLYESTEERRLALLDKALDIILDGTYENMLHYAHGLKSPMTMLHMLGVILPILGLVILPLAVSFLGGGSTPLITAIYIALLYNVSLPLGVYYLGKNILSQRPAGYGNIDLGEMPGVKKYRNVLIQLNSKVSISINPLFFSLAFFAVTMLIGFSPLVMHYTGSGEINFDAAGNLKMLDYVCPPCLEDAPADSCGINCAEEDKVGPYGLGSALLSLFIVLGVGVSAGLYYSLRSKNVIKIRERTKELEDEFSSALFQLGNRLGDGLPAEVAFSKVARTMDNTTSGNFFNLVEKNITHLGYGMEQAIFDPKVGAIASFPSMVIESSMKVLVESIKKGPRIAAQALLSMSRYIKEIHRVEERLQDLMADVISSMKSQINFLTPAIAGIVIGITSMISTILTRLSSQLGTLASGADQSLDLANMINIFGIGMPTYHFQIVVGLYVVQIAFILTILSNGIENGVDKLGERYALGKNLIRGTLIYCIIAAIVILLFNLFAINILDFNLTSLN